MKSEEEDDSETTKIMKKRINKRQIDEYVKRENALKENLRQAFLIAWDMCTEEMKAKLKGVKDFQDKISNAMDVMKLFEEIRTIMYNFQEKTYAQHYILLTWKKFYDLKQQTEESVQDYYKRFKLQVKVVESVGGTFGLDKALLSNAGWTGNKNSLVLDLKKAAEKSKEKYLAYKFIFNSDHTRYGSLKDGLHLDYNKDYEKRWRTTPR